MGRNIIMNKVDLLVGTKFYVGDDLLVVEECEQSNCDPPSCDGCHFFNNDTTVTCGDDFSLSCVCGDRHDRKPVIFKKVEEKQ